MENNLTSKLSSFIFLAILVYGFLPTRVFGGHCELVEGKGIEVCEAYKKNLNSFNPKLPMTCGRKANSELGFTKPDWSYPHGGLTPSEKPLLTFRVEFSKLLWERDVNPVNFFVISQWPKWQGTPAQMEAARELFFYRWMRTLSGYFPKLAEFDIDNDGKKEPVYFEQPCGSTYGSLLAVLDQNYQHIDRKKTELVMPHPPFTVKGRDVFRALYPGEKKNIYADKYGYTPIETANHWLHYDVFMFKGKTYFDQWWRNHPDFHGKSDIEMGRLRVYQATPDGTRQICSYRFVLN